MNYYIYSSEPSFEETDVQVLKCKQSPKSRFQVNSKMDIRYYLRFYLPCMYVAHRYKKINKMLSIFLPFRILERLVIHFNPSNIALLRQCLFLQNHSPVLIRVWSGKQKPLQLFGVEINAETLESDRSKCQENPFQEIQKSRDQEQRKAPTNDLR